MSSKAPPKERTNYYILLEDIHVNPQNEKVHAAGTLWVVEKTFSNTVILVRKYEGEDIGELQEINVNLLQQIKYDEAHILLAVPDPVSQRLQIIKDKKWLEEGFKIIIGSVVEVHNVPEIPDGALATVRYKGRLPGRNGTFFGVELHPEYAGKGSTNGTYRRKKLFSCDEDCGLFLSLLRIRFYYARSHQEGGARPKTRPTAEGASAESSKDVTDNVLRDVLKIGERVVWMSDSGPEFATVRWQGTLPYSYDNKHIVGVEFDNAVGTGTGKYRGQQLFSAKRNHASLLPILGLLKLSDYEKMFSSGEDKHKTNTESSLKVSQNADSAPQRQNSFATGNVSTPGRQPQEHKDVDSGYDKGRSTGDIMSPRTIHDTSHSGAVTEDKSKGFARPSDSGLSMTHKLGPGPKRVSAFAAGRGGRHSEDNYVPPLLLAAEGKFTNTTGSFTSASQQGSFSPGSLHIGDRVTVMLGQMQCGTIRWIGRIPESKNPQRVFAGLEMEMENKIFTSGTWQGRKIFDCPHQRGLFIDLDKCKKIA